MLKSEENGKDTDVKNNVKCNIRNFLQLVSDTKREPRVMKNSRNGNSSNNVIIIVTIMPFIVF